MEHPAFTWFDLAAAGFVVLSAIMAFARGLIREVFSVVAFVGGALAAFYFNPVLRPVMETYTPLRGWIAAIATGLVVFLVLFILITILISVVAKNLHQSTEIGSFDRAAGLAFGVLRGVLFVSLFVLLIRQTAGDPRLSPQAAIPEVFTNARTYPIYEGVAKAFEHLLPRVRETAHDIIERHQASESSIPADVARTEPTPAPTRSSTATAQVPAATTATATTTTVTTTRSRQH